MRSFRSHLTEAKETIVFTFGRFNPPTTGHEKLIQKVASVAGSNPFRIYPSHTTNPKKDPLPHALKVAYMRKMFKKYSKNIIADKKMKTAIFIAEALYKEGFKNLIMVVGSDRVQEFSTLLNRYNDAPDKSGKQLFKFDSVKVVSAGERDPDSEGVDGMSASKMRAAATSGDKDAFITGVPSSFKDGEKLYRDVRKYMGIREERDMGDMSDFETVRDMYLTGKIWNAGDIVEANGYTGEVIRKGTNYLSFSDEDGKIHKVWLHEITLDERNYRKEYDNYHSRPEQIARRSSRNQARRVMGDKTKIGMDVGHKDNDPMNNSPKNLRNEDPSKNRREPRMREVEETLEDMIPWLKKLKAKIFDKTHEKGLNKLSFEYAKQAAKLAKEKKPIRHMDIVHDIAKPYSNVTDRVLRDHINDLVKKGLIPQDLRAEYEMKNETMSFKDFVGQIQVNEKLGKDADASDYIDDFKKSDAPQFKGKSDKKRKQMAIAAYLDKKDEAVQQDSDIDDKKGTQPAKYHKGLSKSTKQKRDAHFKAKKTGPAPGDADAKTKPSVHTKKFKQMYGETVELDENEGLKNKAKKSGMPYGVLKKVYDRGMAAYKTGHRPGTTPQQWAMARVNSFTTKSKGTWGGADKDLAKQVSEDAPCWDGYKQVGMKKKNGKNVPNCVPEENELNEWGEVEEAAEYQGRKVTLNKPTAGDVAKSKVYVRNDKGNVVKVNFGDKNMTIKKNIPARRKSFRARHNCDDPGPKWKARYWSCKAW